MTAVQRFEAWIEENPEKIADIKQKASESLNLTPTEVDEKILELKRWLIANEGTKKVNKKAWKSFIIKNLGKRGYNGASKRSPSSFGKVTGEVKLS